VGWIDGLGRLDGLDGLARLARWVD
jgi:hypothetical protein